MSWYYGTYSCGHEGRTQIYGKMKDREWKSERHFSGLCPECYEKYLEAERERANKEAAEKAKEMELPELQGTEKQVAWANTIRQQMIDAFNRFFEKYSNEYDDKSIEALENLLKYLLRQEKASFFIDNRSGNVLDLFDKYKDELKTDEEVVKETIEEKTLAELKAEATVRPADSLRRGAVEITIEKDKVLATYEKNEDFRKIVKDLGYRWDGIWIKDIDNTTGTAADRAAELGNKLLNDSFPIMILDEEIRQKAVEGIYEPECHRWIYRKDEGKLKIKWQGMSDKLYNVSKKLPGARWNNGMVVNASHYIEIEDFAELYGFKFTPAALKEIENYKKVQEKVEVVEPVKVEEVPEKNGLEDILKSSADILDDLKED